MSDVEKSTSSGTYQKEIDRLEAELADLKDKRAALSSNIKTVEEKLADVRSNLALAKESEASSSKGCICSGCGATLSPKDRFCGTCGTKVEEESAAPGESSSFCAACGAPLKPTFKFCLSCGKRVEPAASSDKGAPASDEAHSEPDDGPNVQSVRADDAPDGVAQAEVAHEDVVSEQDGATCPNCGAVFSDDFEFCIECGSKL